MEKTVDLKHTRNYDLFHFLTGINRAVKPEQVTVLRHSISQVGCFRNVVVADISFINGRVTRYIIDGQNLFVALTRLELQIPFVIIEIANQSDLIKLLAKINTTQMRWSTDEFVEAWTNEHRIYTQLQKAKIDLGLSYGAIAALMLKTPNIRKALDILKDGELRISNPNYPLMAKYIVEIIAATDGPKRYVQPSERFISTFIEYYDSPTYDHDLVLARAIRYKKLILQTSHYKLPHLLLDKIFI